MVASFSHSHTLSMQCSC